MLNQPCCVYTLSTHSSSGSKLQGLCQGMWNREGVVKMLEKKEKMSDSGCQDTQSAGSSLDRQLVLTDPSLMLKSLIANLPLKVDVFD